MFKYKDKNGIYLIFKGGGKIQQHSTLYLTKQQSTQTGCYTIAACFPFEPLEKCMTFKDIFPGLSRSWNFQEKIQDFPGGVGALYRATVPLRPDQIPR